MKLRPEPFRVLCMKGGDESTFGRNGSSPPSYNRTRRCYAKADRYECSCSSTSNDSLSIIDGCKRYPAERPNRNLQGVRKVLSTSAYSRGLRESRQNMGAKRSVSGNFPDGIQRTKAVWSWIKCEVASPSGSPVFCSIRSRLVSVVM